MTNTAENFLVNTITAPHVSTRLTRKQKYAKILSTQKTSPTAAVGKKEKNYVRKLYQRHGRL